MILYFSVSPQYLFSEFTKDLIAARKEFCEACDVESDSEENNNKLPTKLRSKETIIFSTLTRNKVKVVEKAAMSKKKSKVNLLLQ